MHVFEPADLYQKYLDEHYRHRAPTNALWGLSESGGHVHQSQVIDGYVFPMASKYGSIFPLQASMPSLLDDYAIATNHLQKYGNAIKYYADSGFDNVSQIHAMDVEGIDYAVLFRSMEMSNVDAFEPEFAMSVCRAWNDWITDFRQLNPKRMLGAALITLHDAELSRKELKRCVEELDMVAVQMLPNPVNGNHIHDPIFDSIWAEAERLRVPIGFHPAPDIYTEDLFINRFMARPSSTMALALNNPVELMSAISSVIVGGVLARFPKLKMAFLEGNCSWLPWLLWRLDEQWEMFKHREPVILEVLPSEYFKRQCYIGIEAEEAMLEFVVDELGDDNIVFSTDYPHDDSSFPYSIETFLDLNLSDTSKRKILWDNCATLYNIS